MNFSLILFLSTKMDLLPASIGRRYLYGHLLLHLVGAIENRHHTGGVASVGTNEICNHVFGGSGVATYVQEINGVYLVKLTPRMLLPEHAAEVYVEITENDIFATIVHDPRRGPIV